MTKQEILHFIVKWKETINSFVDLCVSDEEIKTEINVEDTETYKDLINLFIEECKKDIEENLVPENFFAKLKHDIELNIPTHYPTSFRPNESKLLSYKTICSELSKIDNLIEIYSFYKALGFAQQNTVLVGANGCGKTSLANLLQKSLNIKDGIVIPAQKLLIFPSFTNTPNYNNAESHYNQYQKEILNDKVTYDAKEMNDFDYSIARKYGSEMVKVMGLLLGQRQICINKAARKFQNSENVKKEEFRGLLDDVIDIWNLLIQHRTLFCTDSNEIKIKYYSTTYNAHEMSDGERMIIYLSGRVLSAPNNGLIIVDEPELHLHKLIANKLWDILETKRPDCHFIYFTHDLDFAISRNCQKGWIKDFKYPNRWQIEIIPENEIPEELLLKLLGSRKPILFCEGKNGSIDRQVFEILFPNYSVQAVSSCKNVINYTKAFNNIPNTNCRAIGIIDRDFRNETQLKNLMEDSIYSYDVSEIENLLLTEDFLKEYASLKNEKLDFQKIKTKIIENFSKDLEVQISFYITAFINFIFNESHIKQANSKEKVESYYAEFLSKIDIDKVYSERKAFLEDLLSKNDYLGIIKVANNKGLLKIVAHSFGLIGRDEYINRALSFLTISRDAQENLKKYFPEEVRSIC